MRRLGIVRPMEGPLKVEVVLHFERRGRMDLSNRIDPLFDALQYAKVFLDDSQIDEFHVSRGAIKVEGMCRVRLTFATCEGRQDAQLAE
jgi:Holliday junction resolvase RusA-like endonuclease